MDLAMMKGGWLGMRCQNKVNSRCGDSGAVLALALWHYGLYLLLFGFNELN